MLANRVAAPWQRLAWNCPPQKLEPEASAPRPKKATSVAAIYSLAVRPSRSRVVEAPPVRVRMT